jgi:hypothetical protein
MATSDADLLQAIREDREQRAREHRELLAALREAGTAKPITAASARKKGRRGHEQAEKRAAEARASGASFMEQNRARNPEAPDAT